VTYDFADFAWVFSSEDGDLRSDIRLGFIRTVGQLIDNQFINVSGGSILAQVRLD
jgi:hypothetical protein